MKNSALASYAVTLLALTVGLAVTASADQLARYEFTSGANSSDSDPNSTAGAFTTGSGLTGTTGTTQQTSSTGASFRTSLGDGATGIDATTTSMAITNNEYFSFTITPTAGFSLDLDTLSFDYQVGITATGSSQNVTFAVFSSVNGFSIANQITSFTYTESSDGDVNTSSLDSFVNTGTIALSDAAFANQTGPVEFRIYLSDGGSTSATPLAKVDNLILNGTAIPEPSTYAMIGLGAALLVGMQRFRRKSN